MYKILLFDTLLQPYFLQTNPLYEVDIARDSEEFYTLSYQHKYDLYLVNIYFFQIFNTLKQVQEDIICIFLDNFITS